MSMAEIREAADRRMRQADEDIVRRLTKEHLQHQMRPSTIHRPRLTADGTSWCALYGENLQEGVAGFGDTPEAAYRDFDRAWTEDLTPKAAVAKSQAAVRG